DVYKRQGQKGIPIFKGSLTNSSYSQFGIDFSGAGDINFDGYIDLIISTASNTLLIYFGSVEGITNNVRTIITGPSGFGIGVSGFGRYDLDRFSDILTVNRSEGKLYVIR
ncbi:MAG: hypothetical protein N3B13_00645, partial [Deltaproteobacteria bacterium]|nr:hypothetical protein [Deltaproteobacteria bacterium]